jgi:hypothetical protein
MEQECDTTTEMEIDTNIDIPDDIEHASEEQDTLTLKTEWIDKMEHHASLYGSFYKDDVFQIKVCIYLSASKHIEHVSSHVMDLSTKNSLSNTELLSLISDKNTIGTRRYSLYKSYLYTLNLDPDDLTLFLQDDARTFAFDELDIHSPLTSVPPTIAQLQSLNNIVLLFKHTSLHNPLHKATRKNRKVTFESIVNSKKTRKTHGGSSSS